LVGYFLWSQFVAPPKIPRSVVALSGRIEGDDSAVAPKATGRILEVRFREGDSVKAGDTIAVHRLHRLRKKGDFEKSSSPQRLL